MKKLKDIKGIIITKEQKESLKFPLIQFLNFAFSGIIPEEIILNEREYNKRGTIGFDVNLIENFINSDSLILSKIEMYRFGVLIALSIRSIDFKKCTQWHLYHYDNIRNLYMLIDKFFNYKVTEIIYRKICKGDTEEKKNFESRLTFSINSRLTFSINN
jgi:hypothetical protein